MPDTQSALPQPKNPLQQQPGQGNPLEMLLQLLMGQMQPRPDLGYPQPVATMAGRVVGPGDTMQSALQRMPMGTGEGDPLLASLQSLAGPMAQGASGALAAKLMPLLAGGMFGGKSGGFSLQQPWQPPRPTSAGNTTVGMNTQPPADPWGPLRQPATRGAAPSMATNMQDLHGAGPAVSPMPEQVAPYQNPRSAVMSPQDQLQYNKLAPASRSQIVPEDIRRMGMGEQINMGTTPPRQQASAVPSYDMWKMLAKQLGIAVE